MLCEAVWAGRVTFAGILEVSLLVGDNGAKSTFIAMGNTGAGGVCVGGDCLMDGCCETLGSSLCPAYLRTRNAAINRMPATLTSLRSLGMLGKAWRFDGGVNSRGNRGNTLQREKRAVPWG